MGGVIRTVTGQPNSGEKPDRQNYGNPYLQDFLARVFAGMDKYNQDRGVNAFIPHENRPYELRDEEDRARIRRGEKEAAEDNQRPARQLGVNDSASEFGRKQMDAEDGEAKPQLQSASEPTDQEVAQDLLDLKRRRLGQFLSTQPRQPSWLSNARPQYRGGTGYGQG